MGRNRLPAEESDEALVRRCQANDHEAFAALVDRYKQGVYWIVRRMVGGPEDEDITQDVFLRAYEALPGFRGESRFSTWIYKIARNTCLSELRKRARRGEHVSLEEEGEERVHRLLPEGRESLEEEVERYDLSQRVQRLVGELPLHYRTVLTLFYLHQVRYEEIAEIMGVPLGTVKTHIHRAKLRLRDLVLADPELSQTAEGSDPGELEDDGTLRRAANNGG